ncbi:PREDICTED: 1-aminocyclopropane-1-carboxylate oxidase homolog 4 [Theobroma cacao]|uniref:1-aminocyclopropane-1-carboxylate oxidase homolog 4 n=1 Tax=Theobroma cacao TaxID=3641 RepID=A0AB32VHE4_THECC|nr:PREDICTED: 1-aminocyclopropane-1-carboxylate oxidase homolog 4 [Theobroma cacao]
MAATMNGENQYDRTEEVKRFDESKIGVKGLVDSGLTSVPRFFIHPPETLSDLKPKTKPESVVIPAIDLSGPRSTVVEQVASASRSFGFFQIVNHGIPVQVLDRTIGSIRAFHEQPTDVKARFYRRDTGTGVSFISNIDLFHSKAASWRDTLQIKLGPTLAELEEIPEVCRDEAVEWNKESRALGERLMGLLSEGLGLDTDRLKNTTCLEARLMVGHYYPCCPQPDLTVGLSSHTDPGVLTVLLQDHIGGLQIKHEGEWVDVKPVPGALVINIADILQILSNDEYTSVEHRVLANPSHEPRVSVAVFFNASARDALYGPFPELTSAGKPALYRQFTYNDYMRRFFTKELDGKTLTNYYRL